jgi:hypothetical protein
MDAHKVTNNIRVGETIFLSTDEAFKITDKILQLCGKTAALSLYIKYKGLRCTRLLKTEPSDHNGAPSANKPASDNEHMSRLCLLEDPPQGTHTAVTISPPGHQQASP